MDPEVRALWERYGENADPDVREQLILQYAPLVKYVAGRVGVGLPSTIEHGDLVSYGMFGLMDAIDRFDLAKGVKFETYAMTRIRGAIIDELRAVDWVPRSVRTKARDLAKAIQHLHGTLKRSPTDEELAEELEITIPELHRALEEVSLTSVSALDEVYARGDDEVALIDTIVDTAMVQPEENVDEVAMKRLLGEAVRDLSEREQTVIGLYYLEGLTLAQIGEILGVTESRICQIHTKAVLSLRADLEARVAG